MGGALISTVFAEDNHTSTFFHSQDSAEPSLRIWQLYAPASLSPSSCLLCNYKADI